MHPELFTNTTWNFLFHMAVPPLLILAAVVVLTTGWLCYKVFTALKLIQWKYKYRQYADLTMDVEYLQQLPFKGQCLRAIVFILYVSYFQLVNRILAPFSCSQEPITGKYYMDSMPWLECHDGGEWNMLRALSSLFSVIYACGIPLFFGLMLFFRERLKDRGDVVEQWLSFLYENYRAGVWWFEIVYMGRRLAISILIYMVPDELTPVKMAGLSLIILMSLAVQMTVRPFAAYLQHVLEFFSLTVMSITWISLLGMKFQQRDSLWLSIVLLIANMCMVFFFLFALSMATNFWRRLTKNIKWFKKLLWGRGGLMSSYNETKEAKKLISTIPTSDSTPLIRMR